MNIKNGLIYLSEEILSKKILFSRHAESDWRTPGVPDHDRELNQKGIDDSTLMGTRLLKEGIFPDKFVSSSAKRALTTSEIIKNKLEINTKTSIFKRIYSNGIDGISSSIQSIDDKYNFIALFGHNPTMHQIYNKISNLDLNHFPTSALFIATLNSDSWRFFNFSDLKTHFYRDVNKDKV